MPSRLFLVAALLAALGLSACGGDTTPAPANGPAPATATTAADGAATTPVPAATNTSAPAAPAATDTTAPTPAATNTAAPPVATTARGTAATPAATAMIAPAAMSGPLTLHPVTLETKGSAAEGVFATPHTINLPAGFHINVYATGLDKVRWLGLSPAGLVYATLTSGRVVTLPDANHDGVADSVKTFASNLAGVQGITFRNGAVYVATEGQIIRLTDTTGNGVADQREVLASDLPVGSDHVTRTIVFGPDGNLYVSAGSSCNVCQESDPKRAAISLYTAEGKFQRIYASGLRNAVGIVFHPATGALWATDNGRDNLGDNVPPETIYDVKDGVNYGWPFCYGRQISDQTQNPPAGFCAKTGLPAVEMQAHSAPLGLAFYTGQQFPADNAGDLFVAFHGSWNRSVPTGYKLVRIRFKNNQPDTAAGDQIVEDFATGFRAGDTVWGRPVDPLVAPDGSLLLTDDKAGAVYRIYYQP